MNTFYPINKYTQTIVDKIFSLSTLKMVFIKWPLIFIASFVAGLFSAFLPWWFNAILFGSIIYLITAWFFPWLCFFVYILIVLFAPDFKVADVATIVTIPIILAKILSHRSVAPKFPNEILFPFFLFLGFIGISLVVALLYFNNQISYIYRDGRAFIYWLWMPLLWRLMADEPRLAIKVCRVIVGVAIFISLIAIFQAVTGIQLVAIGRVGALETVGASQSEFTRVQLPGFLFVTWSLIWLGMSILYRKINWFFGIILSVIFCAALFVNFGRGLWIWTFIGVLTPILFVEKKLAVKFIIAVVTVLMLGTSGLAVFKPSTLDAIFVRLSSVKNEGGKNTSYGWRELENTDATAVLKRAPILGVGIGGEYRRWMHMLVTFSEHTRYIHNSYLFLTTKVGVFGLLALLWFFYKAWLLGKQELAFAENERKILTITSLAFFPAAMGLSITQPELVTNYSILLFTILIAYFAMPRFVCFGDNNKSRSLSLSK